MSDDVMTDVDASAPTSSSAPAPSTTSSTSNNSPEGELPWVEKYRPRVLNDVVGNVEAINRMKVIAEHGNMPNLILSGSPGSGKTTTINCLAREMLGSSYDTAVLELNASDARGIDVVRNKIKMFAQKKVTLPIGKHKIIILDEADSMTTGAQQALRRTMELFSSTTRFALACNQSSKIIEPIQSRCAIVRFAKLSDSEVLFRVKQVLDAEKVSNYTDDGIEAIVFTAQGDLRQAINALQSTVAGLGAVTADNVFKVVDQPHPLKMKAILQCCDGGDINGALRELAELWKLGYSAIDIIQTLFRVTKGVEGISDKKKLLMIKEISMVHMRIADGVNTHLQLSGLMARLCQVEQ